MLRRSASVAASRILPGHRAQPRPTSHSSVRRRRIASTKDGELLQRELKVALDGPYAADRAAVRRFMDVSPLMTSINPVTPIVDQQAHVFAQLKALMQRKEIRDRLGTLSQLAQNPVRWLASSEVVSSSLPQLSVKISEHVLSFGSSLSIFGQSGSVETLVSRFDEFDLQGCLCQREAGGAIETTATWEAGAFGGRGAFVLNTPNSSAEKIWVSNCVRRAELAIVFARLRTDSGDHGIYPFVVPIRDRESGHVMPGVRIRDLGSKSGLNGIDSGTISFKSFPLSRDSLLSRKLRISADGQLASSDSSADSESLTDFNTLRRIHRAQISTGITKLGLSVAVDLAESFSRGRGRSSLEPLLMPLLDTLALHFALDELAGQCQSRPFSSHDPTGMISASAAGLQAYALRHAENALRAAIELGGSYACRNSSQLATLHADAVVMSALSRDETDLDTIAARWSMQHTHRQRLFSPASETDIISHAEECLAWRRATLSRVASQELSQGAVSRRTQSEDITNFAIPTMGDLALVETEYFLASCFRRRADNAPFMKPLYEVFVLGLLNRDAAWFVQHQPGTSPEALEDDFTRRRRALVPSVPSIANAFCIPRSFLPSDFFSAE